MMPRPLCIISDVHGTALSLFALIAKVRAKYPDAQPYLLGDLIDRGPRSKQVVDWAMKENVPTCLGNHEHLCVDHHFNQIKGNARSSYDYGTWQRNGAIQTLESFGGKIPARVIKWMNNLPLYIIPPEYPELLLSHTGWGLDYTPFDAVWTRSFSFPDDGYFRVLGHTAMKQVVIRDKYACIDTGCAYGGKLSALVWPSKEVFTQDNID